MTFPKDFNAKQAKHIADKQYIRQINECLIAIKREAEKGEYQVNINEKLHEATIFKLKELGFNVVNQIPADIKMKEGIYHTITWKYV